MSPMDMPRRQPKHTWSPPLAAKPAAQPPRVIPSADNSRARRAKRNGWETRNA